MVNGTTYTGPACLDLPRQAAEPGRRTTARALTATMLDSYPGTTLGRRVLVVLAVLEALAGRL